jgi:hypothetical protein
MFTHRGWAHASLLRHALRRLVLAGSAAWVVAATTIATRTAHAEAVRGEAQEFDTEHMFGFTEGSEIGEKGETELLIDSVGRFGRVSGSYHQVASMFEAKYVVADRFRVSAAATLAYYDISNVADLHDRNQGVLQSVSFSARYRLLDHEQAPFGLTLAIEPRRGLVDETSGARAAELGAEFLALVDRELVADRLFGAFNLGYAIERTRLHGSVDTSRDATFEMGAGLSARVLPGIFVGGEVRYLRQYEGLPLNGFAGQALYVGPAFFWKLSESALISAAWNTQAWGAAAESSGTRDLVHFDRHLAKLRFGFSF